jgi:galactokinase
LETFNCRKVVSPGIIEHIDYNDGYVCFAAAIDKIICCFRENNTNQSRIIAIDLNDGLEINLGDPIELSDNVWTNYVRGVVNLQLKDLSLKVSTVHSAVIFCGFQFVIICSFGCGFLFDQTNF